MKIQNVGPSEQIQLVKAVGIKNRNRMLISFAKDADLELSKVTMDPKYQSLHLALLERIPL